MKNITLLTLIGIFSGLFIFGQDQNEAFSSEDNQNRGYYRKWGGAYEVRPILSQDNVWKMKSELDQITRTLGKSNEALADLMIADTVIVPGHFTFLGGWFQFPELTPEGKQAIKLKQQIKSLKIENEQLRNKQKNQKTKLEKLKAKDKRYVQIRLLWGFVIWEEEK